MTHSLAILATALLFGGMSLYSFGFAAFLFKDALHNSTRVCAARIGMGCKAHFAANSACYWQ